MIKYLVFILAACLIEESVCNVTLTQIIKKPKCSKKNEEYQIEATGCEPTCSKPNSHVYCKEPCKSACVCKNGYVRNKNGDCVKLTECENFKGCPNNEIWHTCGPILEGSCDNPRPGICGGACRQGCYCFAGYVRGVNGTCIKIEDCPKKCGENEIYENCGTGCEPTCNEPFPAVCTNRNVPGCYCKPGYIRSKQGGNCVETCPKRCDKNEIWTCGSACEGTCDIPNPKFCVEKAKEGCFCKPGYVRNDLGKCVSVSTCKPLCENDELWMTAPACEPSCSDPFPARCEKVKEGCHCRPGLYRNEKNKCVPYSQCTKRCHGLNEIWWNCAPGCPATCDNPNPKRCKEPTVAGCYCKIGYVRNENGECVSINECPKRCKDENEIWQTQYLSCELTCSNPNPTALCSGATRSGCFCKAGYVRDYDGSCVLIDKCIQKCVGGKIYQTCGPFKQPSCQDPTPACSVECVPGCFCPPGYVLESSNCIKREQCSKECSEGEIKIYCGTACERTCENPNITTCQSSFTPKCLCGPNKYRNKAGRCVDYKDCESKCRENEEWLQCGPKCRAKCGASTDEAERCHSIIALYQSKPSGSNCREGCFCKSGYILNKLGKCIKEKDCPTTDTNKTEEEGY